VRLLRPAKDEGMDREGGGGGHAKDNGSDTQICPTEHLCAQFGTCKGGEGRDTQICQTEHLHAQFGPSKGRGGGHSKDNGGNTQIWKM